MNRPAQIVKNIFFFAVIVTVAAVAFPKGAAAATVGQSDESSNSSQNFANNLNINSETIKSVANATWNYSNRSLSIFGDFLSGAWNESSKMFATNENKTDSNNSTTAVSPQVEGVASVSATVASTESTASATVSPTILNSSVVDSITSDSFDLQTKLNDTEGVINQLFSDSQYIDSKIGIIKLRWKNFSDSEVVDMFSELVKKFGAENDATNLSSVFGEINYLGESWNWGSVLTIRSQAKSARELLVGIQGEVALKGKTAGALAKLNTLSGLMDNLNFSIGDESNKPSQITLFGNFKDAKQLIASLEENSKSISGLLSNWKTIELADKTSKVSEISKNLASVNRISGINKDILTVNSNTDQDLRNKSYSLAGVVLANKKLIAGKSGVPFFNTWLETGSIVFKTLLTNPSTIISQPISLKYYLPSEINESNVIEVDPSVKVLHDDQKKQYYVSGEFLLSPLESKIVSVRVNDVWAIDQKQIDSLRLQTESFAKTFESTPNFSASVILKSEIEGSLNKVLGLASAQADFSPEDKIISGRTANTELAGVTKKLEELKKLGSNPTASKPSKNGFNITSYLSHVPSVSTPIALSGAATILVLIMMVAFRRKLALASAHLGSVFILILSIGMGLVGGLAIGRTSFIVNATSVNEKVTAPEVVQDSQESNVSVMSTPSAKLLDSIKIYVPKNSRVNLRLEPQKKASVVTKLNETSEMTKLDEQNGWIKVQMGNTQGWVSSEFSKVQ